TSAWAAAARSRRSSRGATRAPKKRPRYSRAAAHDRPRVRVRDSARAAQRQIDARLARERVRARRERRDAVVAQPRGSAEEDDVAVLEAQPLRPVLATQTAE